VGNGHITLVNQGVQVSDHLVSQRLQSHEEIAPVFLGVELRVLQLEFLLHSLHNFRLVKGFAIECGCSVVESFELPELGSDITFESRSSSFKVVSASSEFLKLLILEDAGNTTRNNGEEAPLPVFEAILCRFYSSLLICNFISHLLHSGIVLMVSIGNHGFNLRFQFVEVNTDRLKILSDYATVSCGLIKHFNKVINGLVPLSLGNRIFCSNSLGLDSLRQVLDVSKIPLNSLGTGCHSIQTGIDLVPGILHQEVSSLIDELEHFSDSIGFCNGFHDFIGPLDGFPKNTK